MYSILIDIWHQIEALKPAFISQTPHFNFITVHYFVIISMAIFGSICLYPRGEIKYIDALFLASGSATQSGLNTVDINKLNTWQQAVLFTIPMITNPITINSFVVFLRLYWFEKRFQHIAREAKKNRRSTSKSMSRRSTNERDINREELGIRGRSIVVMHDSTIPNGMTNDAAVHEDLENQLQKVRAIAEEEKRMSSNESQSTNKVQSSESERHSRSPGTAHRAQTQITFADQLKPPFHDQESQSEDGMRTPRKLVHEDHIAFLERQRKQDDGAVLRIPGPRDADAGIVPQTVNHDDPLYPGMSRRASTLRSRRDSGDDNACNNYDNVDVEGARPRNINFTEPTRSPPVERVAENAVAARHTLGIFKLRMPRIFKSKSEKLHDSSSMSGMTGTFHTIRSALSRDKEETMPYLSWEPTVGRNSAFVDLTESQREELGGIEYRSLKSLALILVVYFWGFSLLGLVSLLPWILNSETFGAVVDGDEQGRVWWAIFTANSSFTDLGYTLTPDSMISFQRAIWPLIVMSYLIIIGNTGFPIMLRIVIWVTSIYVPKDSGIWEELKFLLDHPRRCFTLLFPAKATWWLFWILVILNGVDLIFFIVLDLGNTVVTQLPLNLRFLDGWFQAVSTRTAGFAVVDLANLHPAIQMSYLIMMYISALPIAISVRRTNVYEEKSLGIYGSTTQDNEDENQPSYVGAHLRRQLSFDLWYIFLGVFIISISEGSRIQSDDPAFTLFTVLFETVSAYGTVGLSLGYTNINASFSAEFGVIAKLVIIAMQIRGRHRGLPYELDRAILLPSEHLQKEEARDDEINRRRSEGLPPARNADKLERSRSKSNERRGATSGSLFSSMLHPGPTIPNSHRHVPQNYSHKRRHSIATTPMNRTFSRSVSPNGKAFASGARQGSQAGVPIGEELSQRGRTEEGRRSFYRDGVNPAPPNVTP